MPTRRDALLAIAALPALPLAAQTAVTPQFFSASDFAVLTRLCDLILPRTTTPGASDAGVPSMIDAESARRAELGARLRGGIADLGGAKFLALSPEEQEAAMRRLAESANTPDQAFFHALKDRVIDAYYSTREGLAIELGYQGNVPLASFPGCSHPEHQRLD